MRGGIRRYQLLVDRITLHILPARVDVAHDALLVEEKGHAGLSGVHRLALRIVHPAFESSPIRVVSKRKSKLILPGSGFVDFWVKRTILLVVIHADHGQTSGAVAFRKGPQGERRVPASFRVAP